MWFILALFYIIGLLGSVGLFGFITVAVSAGLIERIARWTGVENGEFDEAQGRAFKASLITTIAVLSLGFISCLFASGFWPDLWDSAVKLIPAFVCGTVPGIIIWFAIISKKYSIKDAKKAFMIILPGWLVQTVLLSFFFYLEAQITPFILYFLEGNW